MIDNVCVRVCCVRAQVWMILSGAEHPHELAYADILSAATQAPVSDSSKQIDKDVHRTFKDKNLESEEGIEELRRVLLSYAWVNADIGYCQSMNFIAATFLLYLGEEDAFWYAVSLRLCGCAAERLSDTIGGAPYAQPS